jgi:2-oxoglutarate ferredoxin oxidoreductase subunit alpha
MGADLRRGTALLDGSRLIAESFARAGADAYIGYPITPASLIYAYASRRFPTILPAPDEITALQWMAGLSATGKLPVSATSFPGLALMVESINMAAMMELPMVIVLVQRLGPSTGTATAGAQDDLRFLHGILSGGYPIPVFCIADIDDCWSLPPVALQTAVDLRSPVVLLTSKEMVMTQRSLDLNRLGDVEAIERRFYAGEETYRPYAAGDAEAPPFLPIGDQRHQVRITASTHDEDGILRHSTDGALNNTRRLPAKVKAGAPPLYYLEEAEEAEALIVTYGITSGAAREAVRMLTQKGVPVSLLVARTLIPVPDAYYKILDRYREGGRATRPAGRTSRTSAGQDKEGEPKGSVVRARSTEAQSPVPVIFAEENLQGQFASMLFGERLPEGVRVVGDIGHMIRPEEIVREVCR